MFFCTKKHFRRGMSTPTPAVISCNRKSKAWREGGELVPQRLVRELRFLNGPARRDLHDSKGVSRQPVRLFVESKNAVRVLVRALQSVEDGSVAFARSGVLFRSIEILGFASPGEKVDQRAKGTWSRHFNPEELLSQEFLALVCMNEQDEFQHDVLSCGLLLVSI